MWVNIHCSFWHKHEILLGFRPMRPSGKFLSLYDADHKQRNRTELNSWCHFHTHDNYLKLCLLFS